MAGRTSLSCCCVMDVIGVHTPTAARYVMQAGRHTEALVELMTSTTYFIKVYNGCQSRYVMQAGRHTEALVELMTLTTCFWVPIKQSHGITLFLPHSLSCPAFLMETGTARSAWSTTPR